MGHDQRFKEFLQTFLRLFFPEVERRLDFRDVELLDKEVFTDLGKGSVRQADVVAKLATHDGEPELVLVHVEVQARREKGFRARMFEYYALLRARYGIPVCPIVAYLRGGRTGLASEVYRERLFGEEILRFRYRSVELAALDVEAYRRGVGPAGAALGALMDSSRTEEKAELRASLLLEIVESGLDDAKQLLLADLVENYLELSADEWTRYRQLVSREEYRKVQDVELTWLDKAELKGTQKALLRQLEAKFGPLDERTKEQVRALSPTALDACLERVLTASSLEAMKLDG